MRSEPSREKHSGALTRDAEDVLARLARAGAGADPTAYGDATLLEPRVERAPVSQIASQFGQGFAARIAESRIGGWMGPVESDYGVHFVLVRERIPGAVPAFDDVKSAVTREWTNARREQSKDAFYRALLKRYSVTIEAAREAGALPRQDVERASAKAR